MTTTALFVDTPSGRRFYLLHPTPSRSPRALVLYLHPFAEELNKSRRMAALQARALANAGCDVLQIDLHGCGDSCGVFGDASWQSWIDDVAAAVKWLRQRSSAAPLWLWGLRVGCLLAAEAASQIGEPCHFLFWQPSANGRLALQQFMRLRLAGAMASDGGGKGLIEALRRSLAAGESIDIAGYRLSPALALGLEQAMLKPPVTASRVEWLEVSSADGATLLPASMRTLERWKESGHTVRSHVVPGPTFWQTVEIEEAQSLIDATLAALEPGPGT